MVSLICWRNELKKIYVSNWGFKIGTDHFSSVSCNCTCCAIFNRRKLGLSFGKKSRLFGFHGISSMIIHDSWNIMHEHPRLIIAMPRSWNDFQHGVSRLMEGSGWPMDADSWMINLGWIRRDFPHPSNTVDRLFGSLELMKFFKNAKPSYFRHSLDSRFQKLMEIFWKNGFLEICSTHRIEVVWWCHHY